MNARRKRIIVQGVRCLVWRRVEQAVRDAQSFVRIQEGNSIIICDGQAIRKPLSELLEDLVKKRVLKAWTFTVKPENHCTWRWQLDLSVTYGERHRHGDWIFSI